MKKIIISEEKSINLENVPYYAYVGVLNATPGVPFKRGFLASTSNGKYMMFFQSMCHINRTDDGEKSIEEHILNYKDDEDITFFLFNSYSELCKWLAN